MKKTKLAALALSLVGVLAAGNAVAADTATLTVQAQVLGTCNFDTAGATLDFLSIDPTLGAGATAQTTITYTCTNGTAYTFANPAGGAMTGATLSDNLPFALAYDVAGGTGTGSSETLTIDGTITAANLALVRADTYSGSVTLDINF